MRKHCLSPWVVVEEIDDVVKYLGWEVGIRHRGLGQASVLTLCSSLTTAISIDRPPVGYPEC